jgi:hypothetical protein
MRVVAGLEWGGGGWMRGRWLEEEGGRSGLTALRVPRGREGEREKMDALSCKIWFLNFYAFIQHPVCVYERNEPLSSALTVIPSTRTY